MYLREFPRHATRISLRVDARGAAGVADFKSAKKGPGLQIPTIKTINTTISTQLILPHSQWYPCPNNHQQDGRHGG